MRFLVRVFFSKTVQFRAGRWILSLALLGFGALSLALVPTVSAAESQTFIGAGVVTGIVGLALLVITVRLEFAQRSSKRAGEAEGQRRVAELKAAGSLLPIPGEPETPRRMTPEDAARVEGYIKQMVEIPWGEDPAIPPEQVRALFDGTVGRARRVTGDWSQLREPILAFSALPKPLSYVGAAEVMFRLSFLRGMTWAPSGLRQGLRFAGRAIFHETLQPDALVIRTKLLTGYGSTVWLKLADETLALLKQVAPDHPRIPNAEYLLHMRRGEREEALACVERTLANPPTPEEAYIALTNKATVLNELKRYDEALETYDAALAQDPNNPWEWHNKSLLLIQLGRDQEALECNTRALSIMQFGMAEKTREELLARINGGSGGGVGTA